MKKYMLLAASLSLLVLFGCEKRALDDLPVNAADSSSGSVVATPELPSSEDPSAVVPPPIVVDAVPPVELPAAESTPEVPAGEVDWQLVLVNPWHPLEAELAVSLADTKYGYQVDERIVPDLDAMIDAAKADGVALIPCYGYRTFAQSQQLFDKQIGRQMAAGLSRDAAVEAAKQWVAPPGTSDHHTGLALDIVTPSNQVLSDAFAATDAAKWMAKNSYQYGFVIRFPADKQEITGIHYESWHLRYVGKEHAKAMFDQNLCLEEYVAL